MNKKATVYLVGAGPGEAGLLTVRGAELLSRADAVVYDRLVGFDILALTPAHAQKIDVGKNAGRHPIPQDQINRILLDLAQQQQTVVRLKGGDPFLFGRGGEEAEFLAAHGVAFEVVPGVSSAIAAPAYAGIPVTHRDFASSLHIFTGHSRQGEPLKLDFELMARLDGTMVLLMALANAAVIVDGLLAAGMSATTPAALIENGVTARQRSFVTTLDGLPELIKRENIKPPTAMVVGAVCGQAHKLAWFERRPLFGCRVLITRARELAGDFGAQLSALGAQISYYPCIRTVPRDFEIDLTGLTWLAFTSTVGVDAFFARLRQTGRDARALAGISLAVVGEKTAQALAKHGLTTDFIPGVFDGKHLAEELIAAGQIAAGQSLALFRASKGGEDIVDILTQAGVVVRDVHVYDTLPASGLPAALDCDYITFTSASCVENFIAANRELDFTHINALAIGAQTAAAALASGMRVIVADQATTAAMTEKLQEVWQWRSGQEELE